MKRVIINLWKWMTGANSAFSKCWNKYPAINKEYVRMMLCFLCGIPHPSIWRQDIIAPRSDDAGLSELFIHVCRNGWTVAVGHLLREAHDSHLTRFYGFSSPLSVLLYPWFNGLCPLTIAILKKFLLWDFHQAHYVTLDPKVAGSKLINFLEIL